MAVGVCLKTTLSVRAARSLFPSLRRFLGVSSDGHVDEEQPVLLRDFLHDSLYNPTRGYFTRPGAPVVGRLPRPLDFGSLSGQGEYLAALRAAYARNATAWLTPAEIFSPHYGRAVANYLAAQHAEEHAAAGGGAPAAAPPPLRVYELGGGSGTLAADVLDWLRAEHPAAYAGCRYTCVEISARLAAAQAARLAADAGHAARFRVRRHDAADAAAWRAADAADGEGPRRGERCFVVATEVLDNLPHDRVWRRGPGDPWHETWVAPAAARCAGRGAPPYVEEARPAADPLVAAVLAEWEAARGGARAQRGGGGAAAALAALVARALGAGEAAFLPTGALRLLRALRAARPRHRLVAADFTALPDVVVPGDGAPLVAATARGEAVDAATYLVDKGTADVFFPTDFGLLARLHAAAAAGVEGAPAARPLEVLSSAEFLRRWAPGGGTGAATRSGYNPLLQDFQNTAVALG